MQDGTTALLLACRNMDEKAVKILIGAGVDVNSATEVPVRSAALLTLTDIVGVTGLESRICRSLVSFVALVLVCHNTCLVQNFVSLIPDGTGSHYAAC